MVEQDPLAFIECSLTMGPTSTGPLSQGYTQRPAGRTNPRRDQPDGNGGKRAPIVAQIRAPQGLSPDEVKALMDGSDAAPFGIWHRDAAKCDAGGRRS